MGKSVKHLRTPTTVNDHLRELLLRFLASVVAMVVAGVVVYLFYAPILAFLSSPLKAPLYYTTPAGSFTFIMKICFMGALTITIPILTYNLIMFVRPAFGVNLPIKRVYFTSVYSALLSIAGAAFAFYVILPGSLQFFAGFQVKGLNALISADSYLNFVTSIIVTFVIMFQIPLLIAFIDKVKPLQPRNLVKYEKWVVIGSLVVAILAPFTYDFVTSILIAVPIIVLYNLSILMVVVNHARSVTSHFNSVSATIVKPAEKAELNVDDQIILMLADELATLDKPVVLKPIPLSPLKMDIGTTHIHADAVEPPAWIVERNARRQALAKKVNVFSDFKGSQRRALA